MYPKRNIAYYDHKINTFFFKYVGFINLTNNSNSFIYFFYGCEVDIQLIFFQHKNLNHCANLLQVPFHFKLPKTNCIS